MKRPPGRDTEPRTSIGGYRRVAINALYLIGARNAQLLARLVLVLAAAIYLGPALYGLFQVASAWYLAMLPLAGGGMQYILSREIGRDASAGGRIVFPALLVRGALALTVAAICFFSGRLFADSDEIGTLIGIFALALAGRSMAVWVNAVFTAHQQARYPFLMELVFRIAEATVSLSVLVAGYGVLALATVHAVGWCIQAVTGLWILQRRLGYLRPTWQPSLMAHLFLSGIPLALVLFLIALQLQGPLLLFRQLVSDSAAVGQLALGFQFFLVLGALALATGNAVLPALSAAGDAKHTQRRFLSLVTRVGILAGACFALSGWAFGAPVIVAVFGEAYAQTGVFLGPVLLLFTPFFIGNNFWQTYIAQSRVRDGLICAAQGAFASVLAVWLLTDAFAGLGTIAGAGVGLCVWVLSLFRRSGHDLIGIDGRRIGLAFGISVLALLIYFALAPFNTGWAYMGVMGMLAVSSWSWVFSADERRFLWNLLRREPRSG